MWKIICKKIWGHHPKFSTTDFWVILVCKLYCCVMANVTAMLQKPLCGNQMNLATLILYCFQILPEFLFSLYWLTVGLQKSCIVDFHLHSRIVLILGCGNVLFHHCRIRFFWEIACLLTAFLKVSNCTTMVTFSNETLHTFSCPSE